MHTAESAFYSWLGCTRMEAKHTVLRISASGLLTCLHWCDHSLSDVHTRRLCLQRYRDSPDVIPFLIRRQLLRDFECQASVHCMRLLAELSAMLA
jgi:hypothetical protein